MFLRRLSNSAPAPAAAQNDEVREFKNFLQEIQREHSSLSIGAQQKLALERCSKRQIMKQPKRGGIMSKLHLCKLNYDEVAEKGIGSTERRLAPSTHTSKASQRLSLNPRQSVTISKEEQEAILTSVDWSESDDNENSLQSSLDDIESTTRAVENSINRRSIRRTSRRGIRQSLRMSDLSMPLFDVKEDPELHDTQLARDKNDGPPAEKEEQQIPELVTDILPEEISIVLERCGIQEERGYVRRKSSFARGKARSSIKSTGDESNASSFLSVDSANFKGDFSAWRSSGSRSS